MRKRNYFTNCADFKKVLKVITSCETKVQMNVAVKVAELFIHRHADCEGQISKINQTIQTMSYECR